MVRSLKFVLGAKDKHGYARHSVPQNLQRYGGSSALLHRYIYMCLLHGGKIPLKDSLGNMLEVRDEFGKSMLSCGTFSISYGRAKQISWQSSKFTHGT